MNKNLKQFFENLCPYLEKEIKPVSNELDHDTDLLRDKYQKLVLLGCLRLLIPTALGGLGGGRTEWIEYNILLSQYSGALLFLQAQHQSAVATLKKLLPSIQVENFLRVLAKENDAIGIVLAANREITEVKQTADGFLVSGQLPWVTGFTFFENILFSFDHAGKDYYSLLPLKMANPIQISSQISTSVFKSTNTVSVKLTNYFIPKKNIIIEKENLKKEPSEHPAVYTFAGVTKALLDIAAQAKYITQPRAQLEYKKLLAEWNFYCDKIKKNSDCPFELRAIGFQLAQKCVNFARIVCGSSGIIASHPLNRINREIWQYTVAGYSKAQVDAYLDCHTPQTLIPLSQDEPLEK